MTITQQQAREALERVYYATHASFIDRNLVRQYIEQSTAQPQAVAPARFDFKEGEWRHKEGWGLGPVQIVGVNYALNAVAIRLGPQGGIQVVPNAGFLNPVEAPKTERAPVVQAVQAREYPPLPEPKLARVRCDECEGSGFLRVSPDPERSDDVCSACRGRGWSSETLVHVEDDIRTFADATCAMRASAGATPAAALTGGEIKALTAMVWGAPCSGHDLAVFTSAVKAMEALHPGERPIDPADGGRLLDVDACIVEPAPASQPQQEQP